MGVGEWNVVPVESGEVVLIPPETHPNITSLAIEAWAGDSLSHMAIVLPRHKDANRSAQNRLP